MARRKNLNKRMIAMTIPSGPFNPLQLDILSHSTRTAGWGLVRPVIEQGEVVKVILLLMITA